jgi:hypothetical protein
MKLPNNKRTESLISHKTIGYIPSGFPEGIFFLPSEQQQLSVSGTICGKA